MGCSSSKVEQQKPVALCRGRADLLGAAARHRFALATAHDAYSHSLLSLSTVLHRLLLSHSGDSSPAISLPARRKSEPSPPPAISSGRHSESGSHICFQPTDSDDTDTDDGHHHDDDDRDSGSGDDSPLHYTEAFPYSAYGYAGMYYSRGRPPPPTVSVEQRPPRHEAVQFGNSPAGFEPMYHAGYAAYGYPHDPRPSFFPGSMGTMPPPPTGTAPPPPPSPPRTSAWDFLNPFASYENYCTTYTPSRSSREVRDEEGIPELEEDDEEVVKEAYGDKKFGSFSARGAADDRSTASAVEERRTSSAVEQSHHHNWSASAAAADRASQYEHHVVDKNVVKEERPRAVNVEQRNAAAAVAARRCEGTSEVANAIKEQFERAAEAVEALASLLEVGRQHYQMKHPLYEVSSRVIGAVVRPVGLRDADFFGFGEEKVAGTRTLASTLQKLYIWERKLYDEVRAEEKMRLLLIRSRKRLKTLDERGAEAQKIDSTRTLIGKLTTKIRIGIQVANTISNKINKLRNEELLPEIVELIQRLARMWGIMLQCHQLQCQVISGVKSLDSIFSSGELSSTQTSDFVQLEVELLKWKINFSAWVNAQRNFVKALNGWLLLCLNYEPEQTDDGMAPYSPRRIGAPAIFVICNGWSEAMDRIFEGEVVDAIQSSATSVQHLWEVQIMDQHERMLANRELERWIRVTEKKKQDIHKEVDSLNRKLALVPGQIDLPRYTGVHEGHIAEASTLNIGFKQIFERMENFTATSMEAYEELSRYCEQVRVTRENGRVS